MKQAWWLSLFIALILSGCTPPTTSSAVIAFPTQPETDGSSPTALITGTLVLNDGCLYVRYADSDPTRGYSYLLYWPHGYSYREESGVVEVLDVGGEVAAKVGDYLEVGGGESSVDVTDGVCEGLSWYVGSVDVVPTPAPQQRL